MIEVVVALLMIVNGEIKEHRIQNEGMSHLFKSKTYSNEIWYKSYKLSMYKI